MGDEEPATWFEVVTQIHGKEAIVEVAEDWEDALTQAETALGLLGEDIVRDDTAFWCVYILSHWCDKNNPMTATNCECWRRRGRPSPYKELVGETIDDLFTPSGRITFGGDT